MFRNMTLFQAIATELWPKLNGPAFFAKVAKLEEEWGKDSFHLLDADRLHKLFGIGIQIWTKVMKPNRRYEIRKIWETLYKRKVRIRIQDFNMEQRFPLSTIVEYIFDETAIHYFSCPNKKCDFGTPRYDRLERHMRGCRTEPILTHSQEKFCKPETEIREQLVEEGILPDVNYENTMFCTYDIGKCFIFR